MAKTLESQKEETRGRPHGREREEGDIDRHGNKQGIGGERAGSRAPVRPQTEKPDGKQ